MPARGIARAGATCAIAPTMAQLAIDSQAMNVSLRGAVSWAAADSVPRYKALLPWDFAASAVVFYLGFAWRRAASKMASADREPLPPRRPYSIGSPT